MSGWECPEDKSKAMNLKWNKMPYARGETTEHKGIKLAIIQGRRGEIRAYVGNTRLMDSKTKKEALKRISEAIAEQGRLF